MKKFIPFLLILFIFCIVFIFPLTVHAENDIYSDRPINYATIDVEPGTSYYYKMLWENPDDYYFYNGQFCENGIFSGSGKLCLYLNDGYPFSVSFFPTGIKVESFRASSKQISACSSVLNPAYSFGNWGFGNSTSFQNINVVLFETNIPIFATKQEAEDYRAGNIDITSALNYKKAYDNGSWNLPFQDIEINDSNMVTPKLSNVSHSGFTVTNAPNEKYMVDVYLESGIQDPYAYQQGLTSLTSTRFVNKFGLVSDQDGLFTGNIDLMRCYGVDNVSALNSSCKQFYEEFPSISSFNRNCGLPLMDLSANTITFSVWGKPFGKKFVFFNTLSTVDSSDLVSINCYNIPIAYTNYKVRFFYYDEDSGFHYGPWTNFIYFSDNRVYESGIFESDDGSVIESPLVPGTQDSEGNVSIGTSGNLIDFNNPNELFSYIRSVFNNVSLVMGNFATIFGSVFSFLPTEITSIIFLGIALMVLIGIIKVIKG